ncbi:MAG TPA: hypothetical protein VEU11_13035 [Terriglobales bacterium]|nr:hypothetical protein [Terriglobales bacterium]
MNQSISGVCNIAPEPMQLSLGIPHIFFLDFCDRWRRVCPRGLPQTPEMRRKLLPVRYLAWDFGQDLDAADAGGHTKISAVLAIFYSHHGRPAAYPLFCSVSEFRRKNQDHLQLAAGDDTRVGIKKDAASIQIARETRGLDCSPPALNGDRQARGNTLPGTAFAFDVHHEKWSLPQLHGRDQRFLEGQSSGVSCQSSAEDLRAAADGRLLMTVGRLTTDD